MGFKSMALQLDHTKVKHDFVQHAVEGEKKPFSKLFPQSLDSISASAMAHAET